MSAGLYDPARPWLRVSEGGLLYYCLADLPPDTRTREEQIAAAEAETRRQVERYGLIDPDSRLFAELTGLTWNKELAVELEQEAQEVRSEAFGGIVSTNMADVVAKPVPWLWPGRIPLGMLTLIAGPPGVAKSFVSLDLASRITTGAIWPDVGREAPFGSVILLSAEDHAEYTIKPRLDLMGARAHLVERIKAVNTVDRQGQPIRTSFTLAADLAKLEIMAARIRAKLIIVDPLNSYLGGKQDGFKDVEVRSVLDPLTAMAERLNIAVLCLMHLKKGAEDEVIYGIGGSVAFPAVARSIFFCTRDPETPGRFYFTHPKINIGPEMPTLAYEISGDTGVVWGREPIKLTAREILEAQRSKPGPRPAKRDEVKLWLREYLREAGGTCLAGEVENAALDLGFSGSLRRARTELGVIVEQPAVRDTKTGRISKGPSIWRLPVFSERDQRPF